MILALLAFVTLGHSDCRKCAAKSFACGVGMVICPPLTLFHGIALCWSNVLHCVIDFAEPVDLVEGDDFDSCAYRLFFRTVQGAHDLVAPPQIAMRPHNSIQIPRNPTILGRQMPTTAQLDFTDLNSFNKECVICLEEFQNHHRTALLDCKHRFHTECIERWLLRKRACPNCRKTPRIFYLLPN